MSDLCSHCLEIEGRARAVKSAVIFMLGLLVGANLYAAWLDHEIRDRVAVAATAYLAEHCEKIREPKP